MLLTPEDTFIVSILLHISVMMCKLLKAKQLMDNILKSRPTHYYYDFLQLKKSPKFMLTYNPEHEHSIIPQSVIYKVQFSN